MPVTQPGSSSVPGTLCWLLHLGWECRCAGHLQGQGSSLAWASLWPSGCWGKPITAVVPRAIAGVAASCRYCRSFSSLTSPNPAGFVSPDKKGGKGPVWLASCTLGAILVSRSVVPSREFILLSISQEIQAEALQSLGGDGICEGACTLHEDWEPQSSCSDDGLSLSLMAPSTYPY